VVLSSTVGLGAVCPLKAAALLIGLGPNIEVLGNPSLTCYCERVDINCVRIEREKEKG